MRNLSCVLPLFLILAGCATTEKTFVAEKSVDQNRIPADSWLELSPLGQWFESVNRSSSDRAHARRMEREERARERAARDEQRRIESEKKSLIKDQRKNYGTLLSRNSAAIAESLANYVGKLGFPAGHFIHFGDQDLTPAQIERGFRSVKFTSQKVRNIPESEDIEYRAAHPNLVTVAYETVPADPGKVFAAISNADYNVEIIDAIIVACGWSDPTNVVSVRDQLLRTLTDQEQEDRRIQRASNPDPHALGL